MDSCNKRRLSQNRKHLDHSMRKERNSVRVCVSVRVYVRVCVCERERDRDRDRETDRETEKDRDNNQGLERAGGRDRLRQREDIDFG